VRGISAPLIYLSVLSVAQITSCRLVGWF